ncbi:hypothetical protein Tco_0071373 [Tanacetum coccineum]
MSIFKVPSGVLKLLESIRRNFSNEVDVSERKMACISWNKVLASKKYGGLGFSSFYALNRALLFQWVSRFFSHGSYLWTRFIKAIYGEDGALNSPSSLYKRSPWLDIIREVTVLRTKGINLLELIRKKLIDDSILPKEEVTTKWVKVMPIKSNVFAWRVRLDKLHTRLNHSLKDPPLSMAAAHGFVHLEELRVLRNSTKFPDVNERRTFIEELKLLRGNLVAYKTREISPIAITPVLPTIEPEDSLSNGNEHLSTIPEKESNKVIKSSFENLVPILSESKDLTNFENECDMPVFDDSSSKNKGLDDIVSIPLRKEIDHLDAIPDSVQSLLNHANLIIFLIEEFASELAPINLIPPGIIEADLDPEEDIRLIEKLLNDDLSPHSPEELNSEIPDAIIKSFSPSLIHVEDSDSLMEEIDIFLVPDDSIPPCIENDDYDSEGDVLFLKELLNDDSISFPEYESFHVDFYNVPSSPRPPEKPPDDDVYFDIEPDTGVLTTKVVDDISDNSTRELYVHVPNVLPTLPTLYPVFDTLLPFSSENEDKVFNPGILISKEEKSPHLLSHRGFKVFQLINDSESPMMIYGGDIPILDVPYLHFYPP